MKNIIDTNKNPKVPNENWTVEFHKGMGKLDWSKEKTELYLSEKQKDGYIGGEDLLKELEGKNPLNANVMWYLLDHQELIPDNWKEKYIFFFGTILRNPNGHRCVLYLCWDVGEWLCGRRWLDVGFDAGHPSAVLASPLGTLEPKPLNKSLETLDFEIETIIINGKKYKLLQ